EFIGAPLLQELRRMLEALASSARLGEVSSEPVEKYWPEGYVRSAHLAHMTFGELAKESPIDLLVLRGVGLKKVRGLILAIASALNVDPPTSLDTAPAKDF